MIIGVGELYDYPVTVDSADFSRNLGINLENKLKGDGERVMLVQNFLNSIHQQIYDFLVYSTGRKIYKDRILEKYREQLEKPMKRALLAQGKYVILNNDIGMWNGCIDTYNGVEVKDVQDIIEKIICPEVYNILNATVPCILYAGG